MSFPISAFQRMLVVLFLKYQAIKRLNLFPISAFQRMLVVLFSEPVRGRSETSEGRSPRPVRSGQARLQPEGKTQLRLPARSQRSEM